MRQILWQKLQSDEAAQLGVFRFVDNTHPTTAEFLDDAVMRNSVAEERILAGYVQHILFCVHGQINEADTRDTRWQPRVYAPKTSLAVKFR